MRIRATLLLALFAAAVHAGPRTSANYTITTESVDSAWERQSFISEP